MNQDTFRILLVEDSPYDAELIQVSLRETHPQAAVVHVDRLDEVSQELQRADLVLCDYRLPEFDAFDVLDLTETSETPVIVVTGTMGDEAAAEAIRRGATDYVLKENLRRLPLVIQRALAEVRLRGEAEAARRRYQQLVEHVPAVVYIAEPGAAGRWTYCSPQIETLTGYPSESWLADPGLWAASVHPADREWVVDLEAAQAQSPGPIQPVEYRMVRRDGSVLWVRDEANLVRDEATGTVLFQGILTDVTLRKRTEQRERVELGLEKALASADSLREAAPHLLNVMRAELRCEVAAIWQVDGDSLEQVAVDASASCSAFVEDSRSVRFRRHEGRAGQAFATGESVWIENASEDPEFTRREAARRASLGAGVIVPIKLHDRVAALLETYTTQPEPRDASLLAILDLVGARIGTLLEHRLAEAKLRRSESHRASIMDAALDCIVTVDIRGRIIEFNPAAERTFGYKSEDVRGKVLSETIIPPHYRAAHEAGLERIVRTGQQRIIGQRLELEAIRADGSTFPVEVSITAMGTGDGRFFTGYIRDITEKHRAERELKERVLQQAVVAEFGQVALDVDSLDDLMARACLLATGTLRVDFAAVLRADAEMTHLELIAGAGWKETPVGLRLPAGSGSLAGLALDRGGAVVSDDVRTDPRFEWYAAPGQPVPASAMAIPIADESGWFGVFGVNTKEAHRFSEYDVNFLQAIGNILSSAIRRTAAAQKKETLEAQLSHAQKMEAVGRLAGGIAHDFNNLLSVIGNYAAFVAEEVPEGTPLREDVEEIRAAADRATALTRQLLAFSRKELVRPEVVDIAAVLSEMESLLRRTLGEDVLLSVDVADDVPSVEADRGQMEQIVMNLAVNARDAMPKGGTLILTARRIDVAETGRSHPALKPGAYAEIAVADTGEGMTPETLALIFEPFFTTKERGKGTGLGLATVYGMVQRWDGHIDVISAPGEGTTFRVLLPETSVDAAPAGEADGEPPPESSSTRARVLVVEDEPPVRELVARILRTKGFEVVTAASGEEALELHASQGGGFDLLLTDVVMPGMSGRELVERLTGAGLVARAIYMSGYTDDLIARSGVLSEDVTLIQKPFDAEKLLGTVEGVLFR